MSKIPEYQFSWKVSGIQSSWANSGSSGPRKGGSNIGRIYIFKVKIHTGYYHHWKGLRKEDCEVFITIRKQKGSKSNQTASKKEVSEAKCQLSELSSTLTKMKVCITAISSKRQGTNSSGANKGQEAPISGDVCNSFDGRASKCTNNLLATPIALELISLMMFIKFYV